MKTVNFLEALEANKTKRVKRTDAKQWFGVYELHDDLNSLVKEGFRYNAEFFQANFVVEPEKIEFICGWAEAIYDTDKKVWPQGLSALDSYKPFLNGNLKHLLGKKTKVTIEVIE